ncbi:IclR family transcriptional regulator [Roseomonas sp. BN140053]|uniref:IclR family transcriptional regulator n=1 Tax=Roseomonas sp. BN140053 TaxID=3391898 RepID=UPI0039E74C8B
MGIFSLLVVVEVAQPAEPLDAPLFYVMFNARCIQRILLTWVRYCQPKRVGRAGGAGGSIAMPVDADQPGIQSLEIGMKLFRRLHDAGRSLRLGELAEAAAMHPSKAHRYLVSLIRTGLVQQDRRGRYSLGPYAYHLSQSQVWRPQAAEIAIDAVSALAPVIGETVFLTGWGTAGPRLLHVEEPPKPFTVRPTSTEELPIWNSSAGRLFAAYLPREQVTPLLEREMAALRTELRLSASECRKRRQALDALLEEVRQRRMARTNGERIPGINSISAPVFDSQGRLLFAITGCGLEASFPPTWDSDIAHAIRDTADGVSKAFGAEHGRDKPQAAAAAAPR